MGPISRIIIARPSLGLSTAGQPPRAEEKTTRAASNSREPLVHGRASGTLHKQHLFYTPAKRDLLKRMFLSLARKCVWQPEAWAVLVNHYHFVARGAPDSVPLRELLRELHSRSAIELNRMDGVEGRTVWHNFRDTRLTQQYSCLARLNYVHRNAVKHGLLPVTNQYPWCSAARFERTASPAQVKTIYRFKIDQVKVEDNF